jgi:cytochrome c55X
MSRHHRLAAALVTAVIGAAAPSLAPAQDAAAAPVDRVEAGRKVYVSSCQRCHGINLVSNGIGYDLRNFPAHDKARFVRSVNEGVRAMPAWSATLKPAQLELLWTYIGSVNGWPAEPVPAPQ